MSDFQEKLDEAVLKNIRVDISFMSQSTKEKYREILLPEMADEITRLRAELAKVRNAALEEAAKIADYNAEYSLRIGPERTIARGIARAIRALKTESK